MSSAEMFTKLHTEAALSLFCKIAVEAIEEQGVKGAPRAEELYGLIKQKLFGEEEYMLSLFPNLLQKIYFMHAPLFSQGKDFMY